MGLDYRFAQPSNNSAKVPVSLELCGPGGRSYFTIVPLIELLRLGFFFMKRTLMERESFNGSRSANTAS
jgi:hypothetical protein